MDCDTCGQPIEPGNGWIEWIFDIDAKRSYGLTLVHHLKDRREGATQCQRWFTAEQAGNLPRNHMLMTNYLRMFMANDFERLFGLLDPDTKNGYAMDPADWLRVAKPLLQAK